MSQITNSVQCLGINNGMANEESAFLNKLKPVFYKTIRRRDRDQRLMLKNKKSQNHLLSKPIKAV